MWLRVLIASIAISFIAGCDDNAKAEYGKESGLPVNCRAYIQESISSYRMGKYSAEQTLSGIDRNCGANGLSWKENRPK